VESLGRILIVGGVVLVALGLLLYAYPSFPWLGRLPGDIRIERPGFRLYLPIASCALISVVVSLGVWLLSKMR
jgi:hypothetical protein